jgi:hypothetical protein
MAREPRLGWITIRAVDPPTTITARLGADRPNVTQGYGGWTEVTRPQRSTLTVWTGSPALRMDLPILFDDWRTGTSVEREISALERLGFPSSSDGWPPRITLSAPGSGVPHQNVPWVIDTLTWGDALANTRGNRVRQQVTLGLLEYVADVRVDNDSPSQLQQLKAVAAKTASGAARKRVVASRARGTSYRPGTPGTVQVGFGEGDDLLSIAAKELGDAKRWPEIAKINGIRDPRSVVPGQVIRLP